MAAPILVTGGTGTLGRRVVRRLRDAGHTLRVLSRHSQSAGNDVEHLTGDLLEDVGVDAAVDGVEIIVHCAGIPKGDDAATRNLVRAASRARTHLVCISVVGVDRIPVTSAVDRMMFGYFASKLAAEQIVTESGLPSTTLRATQFHDLILKVVQGMSRLPVIPVPGFRFQPIDTDEVAARLVDLALAAPAGLVPDMAGPRTYQLADLLRSYLRASDRHRVLLPIRLPGNAAAAFRAGANLARDRAVGRRTWEEYLAEEANVGSDDASTL